MPAKPGPFDIETTRLILGPKGDATPKQVTPSFYQDLGDDFGSFAGHVLISRHEFDEPWPTWEIHPHGDEFVYLLSGDVDLVMQTADGEKILRVSEPGTYVVVPKGTWHTARPHRHTAMLFVTPGEGTLNAETPGLQP
jgi:mannose-6-phosphate isomerase-like protein (cupin superfamily)